MKKNGFEAMLANGVVLRQYVQTLAMQCRSSFTATYGDLAEAVALLEDIAGGGYSPAKQQAVQHVAFVMMHYTLTRQWVSDRARLDAAKEIGRRVKDLPLRKELLALMGDYGEVLTGCHVDGIAAEVAYWCKEGKKREEIIFYTAELARLGCILVGLMRSQAEQKGH